MKISTYIFTFLALLAVIFAGYMYSIILAKDVRASRAEAMGEKYISNLYADFVIAGKNCQGEDTDGDSYVSCDFRIVKQDVVDKVVKLQCPTLWKSYTGNTCKESRLSITE